LQFFQLLVVSVNAAENIRLVCEIEDPMTILNLSHAAADDIKNASPA
jgi:hypothetical protein